MRGCVFLDSLPDEDAHAERILQQTVCYDRWFSWTISVSWGYAVQVFGNHIFLGDVLPVQETFMPWKSEPLLSRVFTFNIRNIQDDPCRRPTIFYFDGVDSSRNDRCRKSIHVTFVTVVYEGKEEAQTTVPVETQPVVTSTACENVDTEGKEKLIWVAVAVVGVTAIAAVGYLFYTLLKSKKCPKEEEEEEELKDKDKTGGEETEGPYCGRRSQFSYIHENIVRLLQHNLGNCEDV
ncbi:hypothetical protein ACFE04_020508 [Oxalis oulophora]